MKTDWRQFRKSTHLASADLDAMETAGIPLVFTIKEVKYQKNVDVSGTKMDGIFCYFMEDVKPLKLNSTNNKILANISKINGITGKESNVIENWSGLTIELYVDRNVKMMGSITDGIRIKSLQVLSESHPNFEKVKEALKTGKYTIEDIKKKYQVNNEIEKLLK